MPDAPATPASASSEASRVYQLHRGFLRLGITGVVVFFLAQIGSVFMALTNLDGSFKAPELAATAFAICFAVPISMSYWMLLAHRRHSILLSSESIRVANVFSTNEILFDEISTVIWRTSPVGGRVILSTPFQKLKVDFYNYTHQENRELITFIRGSLPECQESGWESFESRNFQVTSNEEARQEIHRLRRFMLFAWGLAIPVMWAVSIWHQSMVGKDKISWPFIVLFPAVAFVLVCGGSWIASQGDLERTIEREPINFSPKLRTFRLNQALEP